MNRSDPLPLGATCQHPNMEQDGCHFFCPDCDLYWDENEGGPPWYDYILDYDTAPLPKPTE